MCGIAGIVCLEAGCRSDCHETLVSAMCDMQRHRGPDDGGIARLDGACLGSRRLSIIDLSPAGHMPMSDAEGRWWITYNGEVYNFRDLRSELEGCGHAFRSGTDTEVVLHAFMEWGPACYDRLVGMFAFAVFDRASRRLFLVRDRYGIKPLYYAVEGSHLRFASEMRALAATGERPRLDPTRLHEWMLYRNVDAFHPGTLLEGIRSVLPGQVVSVEEGAVRTATAYRAPDHVREGEHRRLASLPAGKVVDEIDAALEDATRLRLVSDVPVGTLLSGGLDSSLVTAIAARHSPRFTAFHVSVEGYPDLDERRHAEKLARDLDLELVTLPLTPRLFRRALPAVVHASEMPLTHPNSVAYYLISRVARRHGVTVLLSGEGADELFGGYRSRYRRQLTLARVLPWLRRLPPRLRNGLTYFLGAADGLPVTGHRFADRLPMTVSLLDGYARRAWRAECERAYAFLASEPETAAMGSMLADLTDFLSPLLRRLDRTTMAHSVECRVPFLDHRLVHAAINLPLEYRVGRRADKWVLREVATRYVPREIAVRRKLGFRLPLADYLRPLASDRFFEGGFIREDLGLPGIAVEAELARWRENVWGFFGLITLEIWGRLVLRREPVEQVDAMVASLEVPGSGEVAWPV